VRPDHDQVGAPRLGVAQQLVVDAPAQHHAGHPLLGQRQLGGDRLERLAGALLLLLVEIGGDIFHEGRGQQRLHIDQAQLPAALAGQFERLSEPFGAQSGIGEIDGENDPVKHGFLPGRPRLREKD
jgi:hypothetical protein